MFSKKTNKKTKTKEGWGGQDTTFQISIQTSGNTTELAEIPERLHFPNISQRIALQSMQIYKTYRSQSMGKNIFVKKNQSILCGYNSFENNLNAQCMTSNLWKTQIYPMQHPIKFTQVLQLASNVCYMYILLLVQAIERDLQHVITA